MIAPKPSFSACVSPCSSARAPDLRPYRQIAHLQQFRFVGQCTHGTRHHGDPLWRRAFPRSGLCRRHFRGADTVRIRELFPETDEDVPQTEPLEILQPRLAQKVPQQLGFARLAAVVQQVDYREPVFCFEPLGGGDGVKPRGDLFERLRRIGGGAASSFAAASALYIG